MGPGSRPGRRRYGSAFPRPNAPEVLKIVSHLLKKEGAGNTGCALHPRSRVQCNKEMRTRAYRAAESIRHSLRNGFTAYSVLSPVIGFLATVAGGTDRRLDASTE